MVGASDCNWDTMPPSLSHLRDQAGSSEVMLELMQQYPTTEGGQVVCSNNTF